FIPILLSSFFYFCFFLMIRPPTLSTLFPYTTLFRSLISVFALLLFASCSSVRVASDYDTSVNFNQYNSYAFFKPGIDKAEISDRSEEHTSELQSRENLVCRLLLEKKKNINTNIEEL